MLQPFRDQLIEARQSMSATINRLEDGQALEAMRGDLDRLCDKIADYAKQPANDAAA